MNKTISLGFIFAILISLPALGKDLTIEQAFIYQPLMGSNTTAGYGKLINSTDKEMKISVTEAEFFKAVELHETIKKNAMMKMQKLENITIAPHSSFQLKPGAHHIMLFDARRMFKQGEKIKVTFKANGQTISLPFEIKKRQGNTKNKHHHH